MSGHVLLVNLGARIVPSIWMRGWMGLGSVTFGHHNPLRVPVHLHRKLSLQRHDQTAMRNPSRGASVGKPRTGGVALNANRRHLCGVRVLVGVFVIALVGCSSPKVSLSGGPREYVANDYQQVLDRWTRTEQLITLSELDDVLTVTAT